MHLPRVLGGHGSQPGMSGKSLEFKAIRVVRPRLATRRMIWPMICPMIDKRPQAPLPRPAREETAPFGDLFSRHVSIHDKCIGQVTASLEKQDGEVLRKSGGRRRRAYDRRRRGTRLGNAGAGGRDASRRER
jgi:hypothetical protein